MPGNPPAVVSQTLSELLRVGTYTLQVDVGNRTDIRLQNYTVSLSAGGSVIVSHTNAVAPASGTFATDTLVVTIQAGNSLLGQPLGISFTGVTGQANFDNVRLDGPIGPPSIRSGGVAGASQFGQFGSIAPASWIEI